ncbi:MAG: hypothetical protein U0794_21700, partial [Isosphaeraceae bacterium]
MRLTLRTLLAWLDDKLPPAEVKEIGKQVSESTYAKDLVDRIHKVTRQRRLSVPSSTGPDATDPNLVACYIDSELDADEVAEFEKKCLTSDVHLAEVSSVHQILSLIGQKAKVPTEARLRMYQLVKGREALRPHHDELEPDDTTPVSQPIQPWVAPLPPQRSLVQRYGPLAAVLSLIGVLSWAAYTTLSSPEDLPTYRNIQSAATKPAQPKVEEPAAQPTPPVAVATNPPAPIAEQPAADTTKTEADAEKTAAKPAAPGADIPAGAVAIAKKPSGLLLRYNPETREWVRLNEATPLRDQDRILTLEPFRGTLEVGSANVDLIADTEVWVKSTPKTLAARLNLAHGRLVLHGNPSGQPFEIQTGDLVVTVTPPPGVVVGVERVTRRDLGKTQPGPASLAILANEGPVPIVSGKNSASLEASSGITIAADGALSEPSKRAMPAWVTETSLAPFDQKVGEQLLQALRTDRDVLPSLVEASEDPQKEVCRLAITALKSLGDLQDIVPLLKRKGDPTAQTARRTAIQVLRSYLSES